MCAVRRSSAFSLVELSIVLVILGLLTGGILAGQSLIRASEVRSVATEFNGFQTATLTFRDKYFALPGDMANATAIWGNGSFFAGGVPANAAPEKGTYNGSGDGKVRPYTDGVTVFAHQEGGTFWQQLANAGLITGQYNGADVLNCNSDNCIWDLSSPNDSASPRTKSGANAWWGVKYISPTGFFYTSATLPQGSGHFFVITTENLCQGAGYPGGGEVLTPTEMWGLDTKMDDGIPNNGKVIVPNSNPSNGWGCWTYGWSDGTPNSCLVSSATAYQYNLTKTGKICGPAFRAAF